MIGIWVKIGMAMAMEKVMVEACVERGFWLVGVVFGSVGFELEEG